MGNVRAKPRTADQKSESQARHAAVASELEAQLMRLEATAATIAAKAPAVQTAVPVQSDALVPVARAAAPAPDLAAVQTHVNEFTEHARRQLKRGGAEFVKADWVALLMRVHGVYNPRQFETLTVDELRAQVREWAYASATAEASRALAQLLMNTESPLEIVDAPPHAAAGRSV
jgi:hypothetical protein